MREYLFRGKIIYNNEWVYGYLVKGDRIGTTIMTGNYHVNSGSDAFENYEVIPETVGQLLKRYNCVDFYEGDICRTKEDEPLTLILCWIESNCMCAWLTKEEYDANKFGALEFDEILFWTYSFDDEAAKSIDIIGNIYDNPELLQSL